ncbi:hypothetical protein KPL76_14480 [Subtercola sp. PAMC28395]|uniref:hypothetical protein n=1 Tax=Subtercola sp. PAMC28395 TaxID=2846775 RepID=UPI001C0CD7C5|nr:hypothetical protein [Subtercola sp. PAMC28395]QWT23856.1 hypothetical protein KPL76_14480 [Subtercola sp. PAMC28395]
MKARKKWMIWLIVGVTALVVTGLVITVVVLAQNNSKLLAAASTSPASSSPSDSSAPASTPSAGPTTRSSPSAPGSTAPTSQPSSGTASTLAVTSFSVMPTTVTCSTGAPGTSGFQSTPLHITWTSTGGKEAWIGVDASDAQAAPYAGPLAPGSGSFDDLVYGCPDNHSYTITIVA